MRVFSWAEKFNLLNRTFVTLGATMYLNRCHTLSTTRSHWAWLYGWPAIVLSILHSLRWPLVNLILLNALFLNLKKSYFAIILLIFARVECCEFVNRIFFHRTAAFRCWYFDYLVSHCYTGFQSALFLITIKKSSLYRRITRTVWF